MSSRLKPQAEWRLKTTEAKALLIHQAQNIEKDTIPYFLSWADGNHLLLLDAPLNLSLKNSMTSSIFKNFNNN